MKRYFFRVLCFCLLVALCGNTSCKKKESTTEPAGLLDITVQATVVAGTGSVTVQDRSFIQGTGSIVGARSDLVDEDGLVTGSEQTTPKGTVAFAGLDPGTYTVKHYAFGSDGREYGPASYPDQVVQ